MQDRVGGRQLTRSRLNSSWKVLRTTWGEREGMRGTGGGDKVTLGISLSLGCLAHHHMHATLGAGGGLIQRLARNAPARRCEQACAEARARYKCVRACMRARSHSTLQQHHQHPHRRCSKEKNLCASFSFTLHALAPAFRLAAASAAAAAAAPTWSSSVDHWVRAWMRAQSSVPRPLRRTWQDASALVRASQSAPAAPFQVCRLYTHFMALRHGTPSEHMMSTAQVACFFPLAGL